MREGFASLCYHYIRPEGDALSNRELLGASAADFRAHLDALTSRFQPITPEQAERFIHDGVRSWPGGLPGLLFTFDDGLLDHLDAGRELARRGIKALFFVPTCALTDGLPPNPTIIHYGVAIHRLPRFLRAFNAALAAEDAAEHSVIYAGRPGEARVAIAAIKAAVNRRLPFKRARAVCVRVYRELLPGMLERMHMTPAQVRELVGLGHSLGAHSHTHLSMGLSALSGEDFDAEVLAPKRVLEREFGVRVTALSYPFGEAEDCPDAAGLASEYRVAFTAQPGFNTAATPRLGLRRYLPMSVDTPAGIVAALEAA